MLSHRRQTGYHLTHRRFVDRTTSTGAHLFMFFLLQRGQRARRDRVAASAMFCTVVSRDFFFSEQGLDRDFAAMDPSGGEILETLEVARDGKVGGDMMLTTQVEREGWGFRPALVHQSYYSWPFAPTALGLMPHSGLLYHTPEKERLTDASEFPLQNLKGA